MSGDHGEIRLKGFPLAISQVAWIAHVHAIQCSSRDRSLYSHTRSWPSTWSSSNTGRSRRAQQLLADLWGVRLEHGTLVGWIARAARALEPGGWRGRT